MNKQLILKISKGILPLLIFLKVNGQVNLVPNPSFEVYTICPPFSPPPPPSIWFVPTNNNNSTYDNICASSTCHGIPNNCLGSGSNYQYPRTGVAYIGIGFYSKIANTGGGRHYYEIKLNDSLRTNKYYSVGYYIALTNGVKYATNNAGMLITKNAVYVDTVSQKFGILNANPQIFNYNNPIIKDTQNWTKVSGIYKSLGSEKYITIGNFHNDISTNIDSTIDPNGVDWSVYMVDDVFVYELNSSYNLQANAGRDTTIHIGDSAFIGSLTNGIDTVKWQVLNTNGTIDSIRPGFWVHPLVNTCYVLTQTVNGYTSSDTVCVNVLPLPLKFLKFTALYQPTPNPSKEGNIKLDWQTANEINVSHFYVQRSTNGRDFKIIGQIKAQNKTLNSYSFVDEEPQEGTNYYRIIAVDIDGKTSFSEVRTIEVRGTKYEVRIFPNPAKDIVNIECKDGIKEIRIINYLGQEISRQEPRNDATTINIKNLNKGLYVVQVITTKGEVRNEKLIVE